MANKKTNTTTSPIDKVIKKATQPADNTVMAEWEGIKFPVKEFLSMDEMLQFVDTVVGGSFNSDDGSYQPEVMDFLIRLNILKHYAGIVIPGDINVKYTVALQSYLVDNIMEVIDKVQLNEILLSIDKKIKYCADANIKSINDRMTDIESKFTDMLEMFTNMFSGISNDDIQKLLEGFIGDGFDEQKIVDAYLKSTKEERAADMDEAKDDA